MGLQLMCRHDVGLVLVKMYAHNSLIVVIDRLNFGSKIVVLVSIGAYVEA